MANTNKAGAQFTAYIPPATLEALKASAKREHRSINAQLVWFIEQGLERERTMYTIIVQKRKPGATAAQGAAGWAHVKTMHPATKQQTILHKGTRYDVEWYTSVDGNVYLKEEQ
jgi:hypothetical protein